jgi:cytochrome c oxidase cbb3-type subunit 4
MNVYSFVSIATTVLTFLSFLGIVAWAYSSHRRAAFEEAANAPFALPDDEGAWIGIEAERRS